VTISDSKINPAVI